jgi:hypothetical protein
MRLSPAHRRRLLMIALPCLAIVVAAALTTWCFKEPLQQRATQNIALPRLEHDAHLWASDPAGPGNVRGVVFGDSLTLSLGWLEYGRGQPGVGVLLRKMLRADGVPVEILNLAHPSFRPLHLAYFLDEVLAGHPRFLVADLNLRLLAPTWQPEPGMRFEHLSRRLSFSRQLALWPWLRADSVGPFDPTLFKLQDAMSLLYASDGVRILGSDVLDAQAVRAAAMLGLGRNKPRKRGADYDRALYAADAASGPAVALLAELDRELAAAGVWTLYYVAPLNPDVLAEPGMPSATELQSTVARLQAAIGVPDARFLDLHAALPASDFLDRDNHLRPNGLRRVADRLLPHVEQIVGR